MPSECPPEQTDNAVAKARRRADREVFLAKWREQKGMVVSRLRDGFVHRDQGQIVVGRRHADFTEFGLRSNRLGLAGRIFVAGVSRAPMLRGGNGKDVMRDLGPDKVMSLDAAYIQGNRVMVSLIRIDLDRTFPTADHAVRALQAVVDDCELPCMPHLICGDVAPARIRTTGPDGVEVDTFHPKALIRPHLWIELPYGSAVNVGPKGREGPRNLLVGVARGINKALLHLGADPNASVLLVRGKNPLSPYLWSAALNNAYWPSLTDWAQWVDTRVAPETLSRMAAEVQSGLGKGPSNIAFTTWQREAYRILREAHHGPDPEYLAATTPTTDHEELAELLRSRMLLSGLDRDASWSEAAASRVHAQVISYAASAWDPKKADVVRKARGTMRHVTDGMTTRKAQAASGRRTAALKADKSLDTLVRAYRAMRDDGLEPTQTGVAKRAGVSRLTAVRQWSRVVEGCITRCIDKKPTPDHALKGTIRIITVSGGTVVQPATIRCDRSPSSLTTYARRLSIQTRGGRTCASPTCLDVGPGLGSAATWRPTNPPLVARCA